MSDEGLKAFADRRRLEGDRYLVWCRDCGCKISATKELLSEEYSGEKIFCHACSGIATGGYGGSPQESRDISYHGGRFHSGEW